MNTPGQQALWRALFPDTALPQYAHMSVTVSEGGGKLSKRERPKALRRAIKAEQDINVEKLACAGGTGTEEINGFLAGKTVPDMPAVDAMAKYLGVPLPEINVVDFLNSGYLPEALVNFVALLGYSPGGEKEIMPLDELIDAFDIKRLTKSNSLFDRDKLLAFNTEHIKMVSKEKLLSHFKDYLKAADSPVMTADDQTLTKILEINAGARTLAQIERKSRFLFLQDEQIEYDAKAVKKVLLKNDGQAILAVVRSKLAAMEQFTQQNIEDMLRSLAEEKQVGLGKVAQPLRVAICGTTISPPIFDSVQLLGKDKTLKRIDNTIRRFQTQEQA